MLTRDRADMGAGLLVMLFGIAVALYAQAGYPLGDLRRMGPGMFPVGLGLVLAALGTGLSLGAWRRARREAATPAQAEAAAVAGDAAGIGWQDVQWRAALLSLAGVVAFALLIQRAGLVPAAIAVVAISAFADNRNDARTVAVLCGTLCALAIIVFKLALGMTFNLLVWPL